MPVHGAIDAPLALHFDGRLVHAPAHPHGPLAAVARLFEQGTGCAHYALAGRVVGWHVAFCDLEQRTPMSMMSCGKWAPLKLTIRALRVSSRPGSRGRSYRKSGRSKIRHNTPKPASGGRVGIHETP